MIAKKVFFKGFNFNIMPQYWFNLQLLIMFYSLPYKTKQFFFVLIKLSLVIGAFYYIHAKFTKNTSLDLHCFLTFLIENNMFTIKNCLILIFLSCLNWFFEISKWKTLVSHTKKTTFKDAAKQSLGSLTVSLLTPNRIGEYGAKALYYKSHLRKRIMLTNLISNALQMGITCIFGIIGFSIFTTIYPINISQFKLIIILSILLSLILITGLILTQKQIRNTMCSIKNIVYNYPKKKISLGVLFSLFKYLVFSFQFYTLLHFLGVNISYNIAMIGISTMYLMSSILPSIFIFDVVVKGSVAVYLFAHIGVNETTILTVVTLMWLLNFVLPSVLGSYYVMSFKLPKQTIKV